MNVFNALVNVIVKILMYLAGAIIRVAKALLVMLVAYLAAKVIDVFAHRLYSK